jgi:lipid-A-disaccharide synthase-like uncharacterized protein
MTKKTFEIFNFLLIGVLVVLALPKRFWYICLIAAAIPFIYYLITCGGHKKFFKK